MKLIFSSADNFCFVSDCRNLFNCKLKKLISEHTFYIWRIPTDEKFSSIIFSLVCVPFSLGSICKHWTSINFFWEKKNFYFSFHMTFTIHTKVGERGGHFLFLSTASTRFTGTYILAGWLLKRAHVSTWLVAGFELGTFGFRVQIANH